MNITFQYFRLFLYLTSLHHSLLQNTKFIYLKRKKENNELFNLTPISQHLISKMDHLFEIKKAPIFIYLLFYVAYKDHIPFRIKVIPFKNGKSYLSLLRNAQVFKKVIVFAYEYWLKNYLSTYYTGLLVSQLNKACILVPGQVY